MPENAPVWDYSGLYGEETWPQHFPIGLRQSPINISRESTIYNKEYSTTPLTFTLTKTRFSALNKGNNVSFAPRDASDSGPLVNGGPLTSSYCLAETHFHWGRNNNKGCEHEVDGNRFDAELHMVHRRKDEGSVASALNRVNGLCVLGTFIEVEEGATTPTFLRYLMSSAQQIQYKSQQYEGSDESFNPYAVLENDVHQKYYTYEGSLTTPPLSECVRWIVFDKPVKVSPDDFECLRSAFAVENTCAPEGYHDPFVREKNCVVNEMPKIGDNYRSCCSLNGRVVEKSF